MSDSAFERRGVSIVATSLRAYHAVRDTDRCIHAKPSPPVELPVATVNKLRADHDRSGPWKLSQQIIVCGRGIKRKTRYAQDAATETQTRKLPHCAELLPPLSSLLQDDPPKLRRTLRSHHNGPSQARYIQPFGPPDRSRRTCRPRRMRVPHRPHRRPERRAHQPVPRLAMHLFRGRCVYL